MIFLAIGLRGHFNMDLKIKNKLALVTGASRGLGKAIAKSLASEGAHVIWVARSHDELESCCAEATKDYGTTNIPIIHDLSSTDLVNSFVEQLRSRELSPDIVVNNVGGNLGLIDPLSGSETWKQVFEFNLLNAIELNSHLLPDMIDKKWGRICHISSIASLENQGTPPYCAAKAALNAYTRSVGRFVSPSNIILTNVLPGAVFTEGGYWDEASQNRPEHVEKYLKERMAIQRFGRPHEIASLVAFLVSELASFCVGSSVLADGGQGRVFHGGTYE